MSSQGAVGILHGILRSVALPVGVDDIVIYDVVQHDLGAAALFLGAVAVAGHIGLEFVAQI